MTRRWYLLLAPLFTSLQQLDGLPVTKDPSKAYCFVSSRYGHRIQDDKRYEGPSDPLVALELAGSSVKPPRGNALKQQD